MEEAVEELDLGEVNLRDAATSSDPTVRTLPLSAAGDITGRGVTPPESTIGGQTTFIVCMTGPKSHIAVPCGHQSVRDACSAKIPKCPYCRAPVQLWMHARVV
jgi:hypothetical protein